MSIQPEMRSPLDLGSTYNSIPQHLSASNANQGLEERKPPSHSRLLEASQADRPPPSVGLGLRGSWSSGFTSPGEGEGRAPSETQLPALQREEITWRKWRSSWTGPREGSDASRQSPSLSQAPPAAVSGRGCKGAGAREHPPGQAHTRTHSDACR